MDRTLKRPFFKVYFVINVYDRCAGYKRIYYNGIHDSLQPTLSGRAKKQMTFQATTWRTGEDGLLWSPI